MLRTAVKAGLGIGELPIHLAEHDGLVQIWPEPARGAVYEVWLVTHQDLRHTARIAAMIDGIVSAFEDHATHTK
jgi:DNA-binding transcriptional LysR family regulator